MDKLSEQWKREITKRQDVLERRLTYERCASTCIKNVVDSNGSIEAFQEVLKVVRSTVQADRAYIFTVAHDPDDGPCMSQVAEDCAHGVAPQIHNPELQRLPFEKGAPSLFPVLQAHEPFLAKIAEMPSPEREILTSQGIVSILVVPVFARTVLWGFMGFDDCSTPRPWKDDDVRILQTIAEVMGPLSVAGRPGTSWSARSGKSACCWTASIPRSGTCPTGKPTGGSTKLTPDSWASMSVR